jgi:hypothetical protein
LMFERERMPEKLENRFSSTRLYPSVSPSAFSSKDRPNILTL